MRYWNEMLDKFGFNDGESIPEGIEFYREAYLTTVNAFAQDLGSRTQAVAYDRAGLHNWCMVSFILDDTGETTPDALMSEAIERAETEIDVDSFIRVEVVFDRDELHDALMNQ